MHLIHGNENPGGRGFKEKVIHTSVTGSHDGRKQTAFCGSYVVVPDAATLAHLSSVTLQAWIYPTTLQKQEAQGVVTKWSPQQEARFGIFLGLEGDLQLWIGAGPGEGYQLTTNTPVKPGYWYFVAATVRFDVPAAGLYNGKIDRPRLFTRALNKTQIHDLREGTEPREVDEDHLLAAWDFAADMATDRITNTSDNHLHSVAVNVPTRAITGFNWKGDGVHFERGRSEYGAIHFHDDDLEDADWAEDFELELDDDLHSGAYAMRLTADGAEDYIPFFVRPWKKPTRHRWQFCCQP